MKRRIWSIVVAALLGTTGVAEAQILTGRIIGTVKDVSGGVLPGATVTLSSPTALPAGPQTTTTNEKGEYRFTELTPGGYALTVMLQGFSTYQEDGLIVFISGTIERDVALKVGALAETITVSGESPMVDVKRVGTSVNLPQATLENLPIARFRASELAKWSPGVTPTSVGTSTDNLAVMGSANEENSVIYDGSLNKAADDGRALQAGQADTIQEVQVVTLGASAEYQVAQGAVVNLIYKSGTNQFKFDMSGYWYPDALISKPIQLPCKCALGNTGFIQELNKDYTGDLGGPIVKDRLWFFSGLKYNYRKSSSPGTNPAFAPLWFGNGALGKLTWQVNSRLKLRQSWSSTFWDTPSSLSVARPIETITKSPGASHLYVSEMTYTLTNKTLVTVNATGMYSPAPIGYPETGDVTTSYRLNTTTGIGCCGVTSYGGYNVGRNGASAKLNHYIQGRVSHDLRAGFQFDRGYYHSYTAVPNGISYQDLSTGPNQATLRDPYVQGAGFRTVGVWAEDQLSFNRLTLSLGVRYDHMVGIGTDEPQRNLQLQTTGVTIKGLGDMFTWNAPAPRVGFNFKLDDAGNMIARGAYGRAYRQVLTNDFIGVSPGLSPTTLARWNPATQSYSTVISVTYPQANLAVDPNLKPPFSDSYSVGVDRQLAKNLVFGASYVHKHGLNQIGWVDIGGVYGTRDVLLANGQTITVDPLLNATSARKFLRTNAPGGFMRYNGMILTLEKRLANRWRANLSYTYSKSEGLMTTQQDPNGNINAAGLQAYDRPHLILFTTAYDMPHVNVLVAADLMSASGTPFAPQAQVQLPQGTTNVNTAPPDGKYRLPYQNILSIRVVKKLFEQYGHRVELGAELRNVLQDTAYESVLTQNVFASTFNQGASWVDPRRLVLFTRFYF
jgi:hypothetical protein